MRLENYTNSGEVLKLELLPAWGVGVYITNVSLDTGSVVFTQQDGSTFSAPIPAGVLVLLDNGDGTGSIG